MMPSNNYRYGRSLDKRDPKFIDSLMPLARWIYNYYFRVQTSGWHHISPTEKVLLVGSHNGGAAVPDMWMMMYDWFRFFGSERLAYGLMHPYAWKISPAPESMEKVGAVLAHPTMAKAALKKGASVLVYPGGQYDMFRPYSKRDRIYFAGHKGFIKLALQEEVAIVPLISVGAHDTLIVLDDYYQVVKQINESIFPWMNLTELGVFPLYLGWPWGLAVGPWPNIPFPVQIHTRVCPAIVFARYGTEAAKDREYVNECYSLVVDRMQKELDCLHAEVSPRSLL